jgi:putative endonuclease
MDIPSAMNFAVYILYSQKLNRFYVGTSDDPNRRVFEHNSGKYDDAFTKNGIPWSLFLVISDLTSEQAYKLERHIKKMKSKKFIENLVQFPEIIDKLKKKYL